MESCHILHIYQFFEVILFAVKVWSMEVTGANFQRHLETSLGKGETFFVVAQNAGRILLLATLSKCIFSPELQVYNRTADYIRASMERFMKHRNRKQWSRLQPWCHLGAMQFSWSLATWLEKNIVRSSLSCGIPRPGWYSFSYIWFTVEVCHFFSLGETLPTFCTRIKYDKVFFLAR